MRFHPAQLTMSTCCSYGQPSLQYVAVAQPRLLLLLRAQLCQAEIVHNATCLACCYATLPAWCCTGSALTSALTAFANSCATSCSMPPHLVCCNVLLQSGLRCCHHCCCHSLCCGALLRCCLCCHCLELDSRVSQVHGGGPAARQAAAVVVAATCSSCSRCSAAGTAHKAMLLNTTSAD